MKNSLWDRYIMKRSSWWLPLLLVMMIGICGFAFVGVRTYTDAPPIPDFMAPDGSVMIGAGDITKGQTVFLEKALMEYGSFFGDGAGRGPDFTAQALHLMAQYMVDFYLLQEGIDPAQASVLQKSQVLSRVRLEIKENSYDQASNAVLLTKGQAYAHSKLLAFYESFFDGTGKEKFEPANYVKGQESVKALTSFFFWGAWVCGAKRPLADYSYTHNWPFDSYAGNTPGGPVVFWSVIGSMGLLLALGAMLFLYGRYSTIAGWGGAERSPQVATQGLVMSYEPSPVQKSTYAFFAAAMLLFVLQIVAGILTVHDFLGLTRIGDIDLAKALPITITRSWHLQLAMLWISACWIGASIFVLSATVDVEPRGQRALVNLLFGLVILMVAGNLAGIFLGPHGFLGEHWNLLGNQGWEFVELGKLWQAALFVILILWAVIIARYALPGWRKDPPWTLPKWLLYSIGSILVLFVSGFVATPETNFVIADFWRWAVIHMWVEAFFEVFATVILGYFMYIMGFISHSAVSRIIYLAALLFLGSGLLGISHNFYWNAKPVATLAIGSIFSTLQVVPLILLSLEAWRFRNTPQKLMAESPGAKNQMFGQKEAFMFFLAVNFWNFLGAGVFGFIINLPIVNYYEHGTYLTVNHGHAALMGVYGNLSLAAVIFCGRYLIRPDAWNERLVRIVFWSINIGLALMLAMDLFPAGLHQFSDVLDHGFWHARSAEYIKDTPFQFLTWSRIFGGALFTLGGVLPMAWFIFSRSASLKKARQS